MSTTKKMGMWIEPISPMHGRQSTVRITTKRKSVLSEMAAARDEAATILRTSASVIEVHSYK